MSSNLAKAGFGIGILGVAAVLAVSIITLVKVNDNKTTTTTTNNGPGNTIYNTTIYNNTIYNETIYAGNNETIYIYNGTNTIYNNTIVEIYYMDNGTDPQAILNIPANSPANTVKYQQAAKFFANSIDTSVSPCDDFYQYACGKYTQDISFGIAEKDNRMKMANSLGNSINSGDPLPLQQIRKMYQQCTVDLPNMGNITANGTQILNIYSHYHSVTNLTFPLLSRNLHFPWPKPTQLAQILGYLSGKYGVDTLVSQYIDTNWKDPQGTQPYLLFLDQPTLSLPYTYYIGKTWDITKPSLTNRVYQTFMNFNNIISPQLDLDLGYLNSTVNSIVNFEYLLANSYSSSDIVRWQSDRSYNLIRVGDFNKNFSSIDIYTYIKNIATNVKDQNLLNKITNSTYEFSIAEPTQLLRMNYSLAYGFNGSVTAVTFANYIYYRLLDANSGLFPQKNMVEGDEFLDMYKLKRPTTGRPRFEKNLRAKFSKKVDDVDQQTKLDCVDDTINQFQYANARIFIDVIYPTEASRKRIKTSVGHVVDSILVGMQSMIDQLSWMSADSKNGAYSKIQNLIRNIAYPEWITDNANFTKYYSNLSFMNDTDYLSMLNDLNEFNVRLYFDQLRRTRGTDRKEWNGPPGIVNAWYQPELNSISFPAAILRQPFFDPDWPASVNFGSMGVVAGHELSHGFDSSGTQWDGFGQLLGWLDPTSKQYFNNMTQCVINEYNGFCPLNTSYSPNCINGQQTVGENVADNGGIHSAFRAYRNAINYFGPDPLLPGNLISLLTHDQLFFLSFAQVWCQTNPSAASEYRQLLVDPHSPSKYRVLGTIQNFPAFRTAFNCPVNSASAPSNHCNVWISDVNITKEEASSNVLNVPDSPLIKADNNLYTKYSQAQAFFKAALNLSADPCNDFYSYACGSYNKDLSFYIYRDRNYGIMAGQLEKITHDGYNGDMANSTAIEMLSSFYKKCKDVTAAMKPNSTLPEIKNGSVVQSVLDEFKAVTGYKFDLCETTTQNTNADPTVMAKALAFLSIKYGVDTIVTPFVDVNAQRNPAFAAAFTLYIDQNTVSHPKPYYQSGAWDAYTNKTLHANAMKLVENFVNSTGLQCNFGALKKNIDAIINFEYSLATTYSTDDDTRRNFTHWINPMKVKDIPYTFVDWKTYVSELARLTNVDFIKPTIADYLLLIAEPEMIAALNTDIPSVGIDTIVKYLYYRLLFSQINFVYSPNGSSYEALYHESGYALGEKTRKRDPYVSAINVDDVAQTCAEATQDYMQYANARIFTEALYKNDAKRQSIREQTRKVISAIRNSMQAMLDDLPWINSDPKTQEGARNKIMNLQLNLAFPDFIMNNTMLDEYHDQLNITDEDSYFTMIKKLQVFNQYQNYINLTSTYIDRSNFLGPPGTVNAWYQPEMNSITIPEGILQQPYFDPEWPASIKFGAMGVIIGHELTHGFDDQGVQWDGTGILKPWMSPDAQSSFHDMAQCVIDEYNFTAITNSSYDPRNINGEQTQGENIADNGGIHSGYLSYQRWVQLNGPDPQLPDRTYGRFTHDQLFFLSFAQVWCQSPPSDDTTYRQLLVDPHSPSKFRVLGTIQNFPAFRQAFNCPVGSYYAPKDHCSVWVPKNN